MLYVYLCMLQVLSIGGNIYVFLFFILNLTLMHRTFDQYRKALLQRTLPHSFSLSSVIRKSATTVWRTAIHVSSFFPHNESCAQNRSLGWSSLKRESSEMGAGAFLLPLFSILSCLIGYHSSFPLMGYVTSLTDKKEPGLLMTVWIFLQVLECQISNFHLNAK